MYFWKGNLCSGIWILLAPRSVVPREGFTVGLGLPSGDGFPLPDTSRVPLAGNLSCHKHISGRLLPRPRNEEFHIQWQTLIFSDPRGREAF